MEQLPEVLLFHLPSLRASWLEGGLAIQQGLGGQTYKLSRSGCGQRLAVLKVVVVLGVAPSSPFI